MSLRYADSEPWQTWIRFWAKVEKTPSCWIWHGSRQPRNYGTFKVGGFAVLAHKFIWEMMFGPVPEGLELDHKCRVHSCVNPSHLEPVPHKVNVYRGVSFIPLQAIQTHCKRGHLLAGENLKKTKKGRTCLTCIRLSYPAKYRRKPI
jgi:hypothetical protein